MVASSVWSTMTSERTTTMKNKILWAMGGAALLIALFLFLVIGGVTLLETGYEKTFIACAASCAFFVLTNVLYHQQGS